MAAALPGALFPGIAALGEALAITVVGPDGMISYASPRLSQVVEIPREQLEGRRWLNLVVPEDRQAVRAACDEARVAGDQRSATLEWRALTVRGDEVWFESQLNALTQEGQTLGWVVVSVETTERKRTERHVAANERRLRKIVESTSDLVTLLEGDRSWSWSSNEEILGRHDPVPADVFTLVHPDDRSQIARVFERAQSRGSGGPDPRTYQFRARAGDGSWRWLETTAANLLDDPDVGGIVLWSRDVTDHHEMMEELRAVTGRLETLLSHLTVGVAMADADGQIRVANQAYADLCGVEDPAELLGKADYSMPQGARSHAESLVEDLEGHLRDRRRIVEAGVPVIDDPVRLVDGRTFGRSFLPLTSGGHASGHLWMYRDMTAELAGTAERETMLAVQVEQNRKLVEADTAKSDLIAVISHELRTPIAAIMGFAELLRDGVSRDTPGEQLECLEVIARNTNRQLRLLDDLAMVEGIDARRLAPKWQPVDVAALVQMAVSSISPRAHHQQVRVNVHADKGPALLGDKDRLGQLLDNLLANSLKFTPADGAIDVTARRLPSAWVLTVADTGVGVPEEEQSELFRRFFRGGNVRGGDIPGSGLGLAIAKGIADLHGAKIQVDSQEGKGTSVQVVFDDALARDPGDPARA